MTTWPSVTVTVLAHRSAVTSVDCVRSVLDDGYAGVIEVLIREQGGDDDEYRALQALADANDAVSVEQGENLGFCAGHDRLLRRARGDVVVLLNADARLRPGFLGAVTETFGDPTVGSVQPLVCSMGDPSVVDTAGLALHRSRQVTARFRGTQADGMRPAEIWGADGAVLVLSRAALDDGRGDDGNLFPPEFGSYKEDVELAWRLRRLGWRCLFVPAAVADHVRGTDDRADGILARLRRRRDRTPVAHVDGFVNMRLTRVRHERVGLLVRDLPFWLPHELAAWAALVVNPHLVPSIVRGLWTGLAPAWRARRRWDRRRRLVDDRRWMAAAGDLG